MSDEIIENSNEYYEEDDKDYANEAIDVHNYLFQDDNYKDEKPFLSKPNNNATNKNPNMGKIIELENEDEKVHTLFDKINDESLKGKNLLDDQNYEDILRNNINSKNIYNYVDPILYNSDSNSRPIQRKVETNLNKSSDYNDKPLKVELQLYQDAIRRKEKLEKLSYNVLLLSILIF